jgi:hypothetical protein
MLPAIPRCPFAVAVDLDLDDFAANKMLNFAGWLRTCQRGRYSAFGHGSLQGRRHQVIGRHDINDGRKVLRT